MDFSLSPQQRTIQADAEAIARSLPASLPSAEAQSVFNRDAWTGIARSGFLHGFIPAEYGGRAWDTQTRVLALEAFGRGCRDNGLCLAVSSLVWTIFPPLLAFGSEAQKQRYLPLLLRGDYFAADGVSEAGAGSDAMAMETQAAPCPEGYRINGEKRYVGLAPIADLILLFAKTDPNAGPWGLSAFLVESHLAGVTRSANWEKMGLRTLPMGGIVFRDCIVPAEARLGEEGVGMSLFNESMEWERSFILATQVGAMARQLEECVAYARKRQQFGKPIGANQSVSNRIADMRLRLETSRLLLYRSAWLKDQGIAAPAEAAMTKLSISEAFSASSLDAIRIHGAIGYLSDHEIERDLRDATGGLIYAGTSDIQRNLISRMTGLEGTR
jgi:alkylation response protein AidB-like acyl-CoA dehydrogenase